MEQRLAAESMPLLKSHLVPEDKCFNCFTGQMENERAFLVIHRHWIIDAFLFVRMIIEMVLPVLLYGALNYFAPNVLSGGWESLAQLVVALIILFVGLRYYIHWLDNELDVVILTDRRIIDINQNRLFDRQTTEASSRPDPRRRCRSARHPRHTHAVWKYQNPDSRRAQ